MGCLATNPLKVSVLDGIEVDRRRAECVDGLRQTEASKRADRAQAQVAALEALRKRMADLVAPSR